MFDLNARSLFCSLRRGLTLAKTRKPGSGWSLAGDSGGGGSRAQEAQQIATPKQNVRSISECGDSLYQRDISREA